MFETDSSGLVKVYKNGDYLASIGFTLEGTVNAQQKFLNSWSTAWTWQVLSNTDSNVTVIGSTNWQGLEWEQTWFFSDTDQKFANTLTNNTGFDITGTNFYYVVKFGAQNTDCIRYIDHQNNPQEFCFEEDIIKTQNLNQFLKRVAFGDAFFKFDDLIADGFTYNYLFAGQLVNAHSSLTGNGFIVGVTKNAGLFPQGATVVLDPSIIDSIPIQITNYGNTIVKDSSENYWLVYENATTTNTDIFVSKSTDGGVTFTAFNLTNSSDFNESFPHIDINSTNGLVITYDKFSGAAATTDVYVTTCSSGGCDDASEFITDFNVSQCGDAQECGHNFVVFDVNDTAHLTYSKGNVQDRNATSYVGNVNNWNPERATNAVGGLPIQNTGIAIPKNGDDKRLSWITSNGAQLNLTYFDGSSWSSNLLLVSTSVATPAEVFAGYDGNFYLVYGQDISGPSSVSRLHFRQCVITDDCSNIGNWSADLNVSTQNGELFSIMQSFDLNLHVLASTTVDQPQKQILEFIRTPNNVWVTSQDSDSNILFSDANRTYNPLVRNHDSPGNVKSTTTPILGKPDTLDYIFSSANNSTGIPHVIVFDSNVLRVNSGIISSFTVSPPSPITLDPENSITNVTVDFNSISTEVGLTDVNYTWFVNDVNVSSDQNYTRDFNGADADFNIALLVQGQDATVSYSSQSDQNILLRTNSQGIDINFLFNPESGVADVNFGVTAEGETSAINFAVWGFPNDNNLSGIVVNQQYRVGDNRQVCVVVNTTGDVNKLKCENFLTTRVIAKIPLDITNLSELTPFDVSINSVPSQSFTSVSADQNFWFFSQGADLNVFNMITDANVDFQVSNNLILLNSVDLNQTIQPYMSPVAVGGISVIFTAKDSVTDDIIPNLIIFFSRTVTGVGNTLVQSGVTDSFGRVSLSFVPNIDHNFTAEFPIGTIIKTGIYVPETIDATNGVTLLSPSGADITDANTIGSIDVNFLQVNARVKSDGSVDLNQIVTTDRNITSITITIDHNSVNLFTDTNTVGVSNGGIFSQSQDVNGLSRLIPLIVTVSGIFSDGNTFTSSRGITIVDTPGLVESLEAARTELGDTPGTMIILAFVVAIILGFYHVLYPSPTGDNSSSFILVAVIFSLATVVGWIDGFSWIFATIAGGAVYFLQRVNK